jgi:hypothetical protein
MRYEFISGLKNCHIPGLYSLVISDRESSMVGMNRIFYAGEGHEMSTLFRPDGMFSIAPHNRRQDICLQLLFGNVVNWDCEKRAGRLGLLSGTYSEYRFESGILGEMAAVEVRPVWLSLTRRRLTAGGIVLRASAIHTVEVASSTAAWRVVEGQIAEHPTVAYNPSRWKPSSEGLYIPMSRLELDRTAEAIEAGMEAWSGR